MSSLFKNLIYCAMIQIYKTLLLSILLAFIFGFLQAQPTIKYPIEVFRVRNYAKHLLARDKSCTGQHQKLFRQCNLLIS